MSIKIIKSSSGPSTEERLLNLLVEQPQGLSLITMSQQLNRPVSLLGRCLKILIATKVVFMKYNNETNKPIYYANLLLQSEKKYSN